ncbi:MAG: hypothetical protein H6767_03080 [Candidatus Peribacteria bacterium]|nr:MAG: hypothetical protein H6767_03080 [Candidatus Peribacteria bacterium]
MFSYIHIPFCEQKCKYCRFASIGNIQKYQVQKYVSFLENEILTIDSKLQQHGVITPKDSILGQKLESLYF